ncbi:MAG: aminodeoxychorismate synthase component I [Bacteroidales bacterium]|nr:aminodeoxychorismate synthase component I [Bacteroidales bacterium]
MNNLGAKKVPFLFIISFDKNEGLVEPLSEINDEEIMYNFNGHINYINEPVDIKPNIKFLPEEFHIYKNKFNKVQRYLHRGDSFLVNLTVKTRINMKHSLNEIFHMSHARYKLWFKNRFVLFSPETFCKIQNGIITTYPMKGTIDASEYLAEKKILEDKKETAEHATVVDLLRNDLSMVAGNVRVRKFRYTEKIHTNTRDLIQVSSEICGNLPENYHHNIGDIIFSMLPAGSISGAPKKKTLEIIREVEGYDRGFYTGVFGYFDGNTLDSGVMIRFIEKSGDLYFYKSGGGITYLSKPEEEYNELVNKIYVPVG